MKELILVGNPNVGKTTLFNSLTKSNDHTGNWHGVTVDSKLKTYTYKNEQFNIVDLPGIYSLAPYSFEEKLAVEYLYTHNESVVINIVDINNISKNLYLTLELIEAKIPTIVVINKTAKINSRINVNALKKLLGVPVFC